MVLRADKRSETHRQHKADPHSVEGLLGMLYLARLPRIESLIIESMCLCLW